MKLLSLSETSFLSMFRAGPDWIRDHGLGVLVADPATGDAPYTRWPFCRKKQQIMISVWKVIIKTIQPKL